MKTMIKKHFFALFLLLAGTAGVQAQMTIGSQNEPHKGAVLDLNSTTKGLLLTNVSLDDVNVLQVVTNPTATEKTKATGMVVYNTNASVTGGAGAGIYVWNGSKWMTAGSTHLPETPAVSVTGVSLNRATISIAVGSEEVLIATVAPANATNKSVTWTSSNETVATVSGGIVTALAPGTTTISVTTIDGNKTATCSVTVTGTATPEPGTVQCAGLTFMDRNLGADPIADPNPSSYDAGTTASPTGSLNGNYYQWGRTNDGHEKWNSPVVAGPVPEIDGNGQVPSSDLTHFGKFITTSTTDWRTNQDDNLWNDTGTDLVNPCPPGFRVPSKPEWESVNAAITASNRSALTASRESVNVGSTTFFLPAAGCRHYSNGTFNGVGSFGYYWSSAVNGTNAYTLIFNSSGSNVSSTARAYGMSVRCVKKN